MTSEGASPNYEDMETLNPSLKLSPQSSLRRHTIFCTIITFSLSVWWCFVELPFAIATRRRRTSFYCDFLYLISRFTSVEYQGNEFNSWGERRRRTHKNCWFHSYHSLVDSHSLSALPNISFSSIPRPSSRRRRVCARPNDIVDFCLPLRISFTFTESS